MVTICPEPAGAAGAVERLLDQVFGVARFAKTCERLREGRLPASGLSFVAEDEDTIVGTIRFWPLTIGDRDRALLLGPVAVAPNRQGRGVGSALIGKGLEHAARLGHGGVILVGDYPYYSRFGFRRHLTVGMTLPGPVERGRFLGRELHFGGLRSVRGPVMPAGLPQPPSDSRRLAA